MLTFLGHLSQSLLHSCLTDQAPPFSHFGLTALAKHDLVHFWVQLGHDGLAQKAAFSAEATVEVYDSWYDLPQNPYKKDTEIVRREALGSDLVIGKTMINVQRIIFIRYF